MLSKINAKQKSKLTNKAKFQSDDSKTMKKSLQFGCLLQIKTKLNNSEVVLVVLTTNSRVNRFSKQQTTYSIKQLYQFN